jgi:hydroxymethylbilane synthase
MVGKILWGLPDGWGSLPSPDLRMKNDEPIRIATRGSALALAQAHRVCDRCRALFPDVRFDIAIIKTTGDKLQSASLSHPDPALPKGLFTKELEIALLEHEADMAVHSLKDLPTTLPDGLCLGAVPERVDVRDLLVVRTLVPPGSRRRISAAAAGVSCLAELRPGATVATSSTRRRAQLLDARPDLRVVEIRGNVLTRLEKLAQSLELDATLLAAAGLDRLGIRCHQGEGLAGENVPPGLQPVLLDLELMLPCVGQGALGIEMRVNDERVAAICSAMNHPGHHACTIAERAFLAAVGGGCQSPVAAFADAVGDELRLRAVSFVTGSARRGERRGTGSDPGRLGVDMAMELHGGMKA